MARVITDQEKAIQEIARRAINRRAKRAAKKNGTTYTPIPADEQWRLKSGEELDALATAA